MTMDVNSLKPLHKLATCVGLIPYSSKPSKLHQVYSLILICCVNLIAICTYYLKLKFVNNQIPQVTTVIDVLICASSILFVDVAVITVTICKPKKLRSLIKILRKVPQCETNKLVIWIELGAFHVGYLGYFAYSLFVVVKATNSILIFHLCERVCTYYVLSVSILVILNYVYILKWQFRQIRLNLKSFLCENIPKAQIYTVKLQEPSLRVKCFRSFYCELSDAVEIFNELFGWQLLILFVTIGIGIVQTIDSSSFNPNSYVSENFDDSYKVHVSLIHSFRCGILIVMGVVVAVTCDMTTKEAQKTATVCYNLLLDVPLASTNVQDRILREELVLLAQQATHQCPYFSAAGFFNVDYTMLFGLLGTVTSYVIVLIQINK